MRKSVLAVHVVALALWLGSLVFAAASAGTLFHAVKQVCPACMKPIGGPEIGFCAGCGAINDFACKECGLEHEGSHALVSPGSVPTELSKSPAFGAARAPSGATSQWSRVVTRAKVSPVRTLLWRLDATNGVMIDSRWSANTGACFDLPRPAVGDALARTFELSQAVGIAAGLFALATVLLTAPGGALRLFRGLALAGALALGAWGISLGVSIASQRIPREVYGDTGDRVAEFGKTHGLANAANVAELVLVLIALVLVTMKRDPDATTPAGTLAAGGPPS